MEGYRPATKQVKVRLGPWVDANLTLFQEGATGNVVGPKSDAELAIEEFNQALVLVQEGKQAEALLKLDRASELDDTIYEPVQAKAQICFDQGKFDEALSLFQKAMALGSTEGSNDYFLSEIYRAKGDEAKAEEYSKKYLAEADDLSVDLLYNMAVQALNKNDDEAAKGHLLKIVEKDPQYADAHRELGYIFIRGGENAKAKEHFQRYLELAPGAGDAADVRSLLEVL
jgi:Tfp pilus assembly protein PilF